MQDSVNENRNTLEVAERRARVRQEPSSLILVTLNGENRAVVCNIHEDGMAIAATMTFSVGPLKSIQMQSPGSFESVEVSGEILWRNESHKQGGIRFTGVTEEIRKQIKELMTTDEEADEAETCSEPRRQFLAGDSTSLTLPKLCLPNLGEKKQPSVDSSLDDTKNLGAALPRSTASSPPFAFRQETPELRGIACDSNNGPTQIERRAQPRTRIVPLGFIQLGDTNGGIALNVSEAGMALTAATMLPEDRVPELRLQFPDSSEWVELQGRVIWRSASQKEAGVEFVNLAPHARKQIREWVASQKKCDPTAVEETYSYRVRPADSSDEVLENQEIQIPIWTKAQDPESPSVSRAYRATSAEVVKKSADAEAPHRVPYAPLQIPSIYRAAEPRSAKRSSNRPGRPAMGVLTWTFALGLAGIIGIAGWAISWKLKERASMNESAPLVLEKPAPVARQSVGPLALSAPLTSVDHGPATVAASRPPFAAEESKAHELETAPTKPSGPSQASAGNTSAALSNGAMSEPQEIGQRRARILAQNLQPPRSPASRGSIASSITPPTAVPFPPGPTQVDLGLGTSLASLPKPPSALGPVLSAEPKTGTAATSARLVMPANSKGSVFVRTDPYPSLRIPANGGAKKSARGESLQLGHLISRIDPAYPEQAEAHGIEGTVTLHVQIGSDGSVEKLLPVNGPPELVAEVINAVKQWRYSETLLAGQRVETEEDIAVTFKLSSGSSARN